MISAHVYRNKPHHKFASGMIGMFALSAVGRGFELRLDQAED
jgi:hypothetical protein